MTTKQLTKQFDKRLQKMEQDLTSLHQQLALLHVRTVEEKTAQEIGALWKAASVMLKGKLPIDPVAWQRKIRAEWHRDWDIKQ